MPTPNTTASAILCFHETRSFQKRNIGIPTAMKSCNILVIALAIKSALSLEHTKSAFFVAEPLCLKYHLISACFQYERKGRQWRKSVRWKVMKYAITKAMAA